jgi:hypothetical protein
MIHPRFDDNHIQDPRGPVGEVICRFANHVRRQVAEFRLGGDRLGDDLALVDDFLAGRPCPGEIGIDEPVFLMRAQDDAFVEILTYAIGIYRERQAASDVECLERHLELARRWREVHPTKMADVPPDARLPTRPRTVPTPEPEITPKPDKTDVYTARNFSDLAADVRRADRITFSEGDCADRFGGDSSVLTARGKLILAAALDLAAAAYSCIAGIPEEHPG